MHTTHYERLFIEVAEDCKSDVGTSPPVKEPATVARMQYDMLVEEPYRYTSDEIVFGVYAARAGIPEGEMDAARAAFFSKGQPCLRSSPLAKAYGWGFHFDDAGRVAIVPRESERYREFASDAALVHLAAMRNSRR